MVSPLRCPPRPYRSRAQLPRRFRIGLVLPTEIGLCLRIESCEEEKKKPFQGGGGGGIYTIAAGGEIGASSKRGLESLSGL